MSRNFGQPQKRNPVDTDRCSAEIKCECCQKTMLPCDGVPAWIGVMQKIIVCKECKRKIYASRIAKAKKLLNLHTLKARARQYAK